MSLRWGLVVGGLGMMVVVAVAVFLPGDAVTRALVVIGYILAAIKTMYDIWEKERERKKKTEDGNEQLSLTPTFRWHDVGSRVVGVEAYNSGKVPVAIRSAALVVKTELGESEAYPLETMTPPKHRKRSVNGRG